MKKKVFRERYNITEEEVQAVAIGIKEFAKETNKKVDEVVEDIIEETKTKRSIVTNTTAKRKKEVK